MAVAALDGRVVAFLEARRAPELASLIARHGGVPLSAPCLQEVHQPDAPQMIEAVAVLCRPDTDLAIFLTGVGAAALFEAADRHGRAAELFAALAHKRIAVRGPKPAAALRRAGVHFDLAAPPPHTTPDLLRALDALDLHGKTVAVQMYGGPNPALRETLVSRGARVVELFPYAWDRPLDQAPVVVLLDALDAGAVDALLVTSAVQVVNLFAIARERGREDALRAALRRCPVGAQGPVAAAALAQAGVAAAFQPEHGHMGALVLASAGYLAGKPPRAAAPTHSPSPLEESPA